MDPKALPRSNAGRKTELNGEPVERHQVMLDEMTVRKLRVLGEGNVSKGVRQATLVAYEQYQRGR